MDVVMPVPAVDFNFDSNCSSPYMTAPSSPQRIGSLYFSAPASPVASDIPFEWEQQKHETQTRRKSIRQDGHDHDDDGGNQDFAFDFSGHLDRNSDLLAADELFDGGKIRPLKPGGYDSNVGSTVSSPRSTKLSHAKKNSMEDNLDHERGRERKPTSYSNAATYAHKGSRSLSPMRVSDIIFQAENNTQQSSSKASKSSTSSSFLSIFSSTSFPKNYKKWNLKDFLLFRSASEGRATDKDTIGKYTFFSRKPSEDVKNSSFRSTESVSSAVGSPSRRKAPVSAHELHYTANRAAAEEMKKKTVLPYKHGLLGCLKFNHNMHEISRGIGSMTHR